MSTKSTLASRYTYDIPYITGWNSISGDVFQALGFFILGRGNRIFAPLYFVLRILLGGRGALFGFLCIFSSLILGTGYGAFPAGGCWMNHYGC